MTTKGRILIAGSGLLFAGLALAQSNNEKVEQIVVTGARTPLTINQLGSATTVITREEIEARQARYVTDLLRTVPGFSISHSGVVGSQTQVRVRGSEANHVLVLIDGVRANDPATGDEFRWEHLSAVNVERIEIVRGAQSSLWGSDAVAAVVHVITRDGRQATGLEGFAEGGSSSTGNVGMSGSVAGDHWSFNGGASFFDTDGSNISREGGERDGSDMLTASLLTRFEATEDLSMEAGVRLTDAMSEFDPVDYFTTGLPTDGDHVTESDNLFGHIGVSLKTLEDRITHHLNLGYFDSAHVNRIDGAWDSSTASDRSSLTYQADIRLGENLLSLAAEHEETAFEQRGVVLFGDPNQDQEMSVTSVIAEYQWLSGERFTWIAGARFDDSSDFDDIVTGRLSLAYELSERVRLRSSIGTGQKAPTFIERFGFFPGQFIGNPDLKPEKSTSYDVGADVDFLDGALQVQATLFRQDLEDEINGFVFDPDTFLSTAANMAGESDRSGVELATRWNTGHGVDVGASYTYTDTTEQNFAGNSVRELRRPRHAGSVSLGFLSRDEVFQATLTGDYGGTRQDIFFPPWPEPPATVTLQNYWVVDLTMQYRVNASVALYARGNNLLDEKYEQVYGYRTQGRVGTVGVRVNFGQ
jgi:vitamin B12 transporter